MSPCRLVGEYVLEPVPTAGAKLAFAFGKRWFGVIEGQPGVEVIDRLGKGGRLQDHVSPAAPSLWPATRAN